MVYYSGAGDGFVQVFDRAAWNDAHDDTTGDAADYTAIRGLCYSSVAAGYYDIGRNFLPFDTSAIPSTAVITAATLSVYPDLNVNNDNDGNDFIRVVQTDQPSTSALTTADFNNCGATDNPTAGATDIDFSSLGAGAYRTFTLNSTGRGWISKTGTTMLGLREGHDCVDDPPDAMNAIRIKYSEETGTSTDPYLDVTYHTPQINIGDVWKEISAVQINIGDVWKSVSGMQINIGDDWKTIF